jgi:aspartate/methionine/tyrosine aminotransferase
MIAHLQGFHKRPRRSTHGYDGGVIEPFLLERYFAEHEFATPHLLCSSDLETLPMRDLVATADAESAALWDDLRLSYTETTGHPLLRAELASLYDTIDADDVVTFAGASEAITCLVSGLVASGDHVIATWPAYQSLYEVARNAGADVTMLELHAEDGWAIDLAAVAAALRPTTRLIVVNAPHNPTGMLPAPDVWNALADLAADAGATLLCDEVYRLLEHDPADRLPAGADLGEHVVSVGVLSKSYGLAGLRIGWLATRSAAIRAAAIRVKDYGSMCNAAPAEILGVMALRSADEILTRNRELVVRNVALVDDLLARHADRMTWHRPRAGAIGFPRLLGDEPVDDFCARLRAEQGVLLLPGTVYGHGGNHFRIGFGRIDAPDALARLDAFLQTA